MQFTCKTCGKDFKRKLTLKEKNDKYKSKFCHKDCAEAYARVKEVKITKKKKRGIPQSSKEEKNFGEVIKSFFPKLQSQYQINGYDHHYDFYLPDLDLLIEYNGTYWHNMPKTKNSDRKHLSEATARGVYLAVITDEEWKSYINSGVPDKKKLVKLLEYSTKNMKK